MELVVYGMPLTGAVWLTVTVGRQTGLVPGLARAFLALDVPTNYRLIQARGAHAVAARPETPAEQHPLRFHQLAVISHGALPFRKPNVMATEHFGGVLNSMWLWSG